MAKFKVGDKVIPNERYETERDTYEEAKKIPYTISKISGDSFEIEEIDKKFAYWHEDYWEYAIKKRML